MGNGYSPRIQPRSLWASVVHVFVATSLKADCSVARLRRCEPPPSRNYFRGLMWLSTSAATGLSAAVLTRFAPRSRQLFFRSHASSMSNVPTVPSRAPGDPGRRPCRMRHALLHCRLRGDGGGSHRLAGPAASSSLLVGLSTGSNATHTRSRRPDDVLCWTQSRPPTASDESNRAASSGGAYQMTYVSMARVHTDAFPLMSTVPSTAMSLGDALCYHSVDMHRVAWLRVTR
jgi:hypothetical protein